MKRVHFKKALKRPIHDGQPSLIPVELVYEMARCKDETIKAKNYAIELLVGMLEKEKGAKASSTEQTSVVGV